MDGFHLAGAELVRLGRQNRKGAPDTFDAAGFTALLRRLRAPDGEVVYAPEFRREIEEPIAGALAVAPDVPLVVTEGNYLLLGDGPWGPVRGLLDEAWYVMAPDGSCASSAWSRATWRSARRPTPPGRGSAQRRAQRRTRRGELRRGRPRRARRVTSRAALSGGRTRSSAGSPS